MKSVAVIGPNANLSRSIATYYADGNTCEGTSWVHVCGMGHGVWDGACVCGMGNMCVGWGNLYGNGFGYARLHSLLSSFDMAMPRPKNSDPLTDYTPTSSTLFCSGKFFNMVDAVQQYVHRLDGMSGWPYTRAHAALNRFQVHVARDDTYSRRRHHTLPREYRDVHMHSHQLALSISVASPLQHRYATP